MHTRRLAVAGAVVLGALSAVPCHALPLTFAAGLTGPNEFPPVPSPATGFATVIIDAAAHTMFVDADFAGLLGPTTAAHIHVVPPGAPTPVGGVATTVPTFPGFPLGVLSGSYSQLFDTLAASTYNPAFLTANGEDPLAAETALFDAIGEGRAYFNIHSEVFRGGEIRGFLEPVPEPGTMLLLASGVAALGLKRRRG